MLSKLAKYFAKSPSERYVDLYCRNGIYITAANAQTVDGVLCQTLPSFTCPADSARQLLLGQIREALAAFRGGVAHPDFFEAPDKLPSVRAVGLKSYRRFVDGAKFVALVERDTAWVLCPSRNGGATGPGRGFTPTGDELQIDSMLDDSSILSCIEKAFKLCRGNDA